MVKVWIRITSYNVCYTKLLRGAIDACGSLMTVTFRIEDLCDTLEEVHTFTIPAAPAVNPTFPVNA